MSGGSYDFLFGKAPWIHTQASEMQDRLRELGVDDAADETLALAALPSQALRDLWHAVEWHDSGDMGKDDLSKEIERWRSHKGPAPRKPMALSAAPIDGEQTVVAVAFVEAWKAFAPHNDAVIARSMAMEQALRVASEYRRAVVAWKQREAEEMHRIADAERATAQEEER